LKVARDELQRRKQVKEAKMDNKEVIEKILREEMITTGIDVESAKTGQMWAFDAERLAKRICKLPPAEEELLEHEIKHIEIALKEHYKDEWCSVCDNIARKLGFNS